MSDPYIGEIRMFGGNFAPAGWAYCNGAILPISEYESLFNLIGTTYGGDGESTFALPDLRGRVPLHMGSSGSGPTRILAETGGVETVTLTTAQMPSHTHPFGAAASSTGTSPAGAVPGGVTSGAHYYAGTPSGTVDMGQMSLVGGSQPHDNMAPYLCVTFIISLFGIFPSPT